MLLDFILLDLKCSARKWYYSIFWPLAGLAYLVATGSINDPLSIAVTIAIAMALNAGFGAMYSIVADYYTKYIEIVTASRVGLVTYTIIKVLSSIVCSAVFTIPIMLIPSVFTLDTHGLTKILLLVPLALLLSLPAATLGALMAHIFPRFESVGSTGSVVLLGYVFAPFIVLKALGESNVAQTISLLFPIAHIIYNVNVLITILVVAVHQVILLTALLILVRRRYA